MKQFLFALILTAFCAPAFAGDKVYEGPWYTTKNRKLEGIMTCVVTDKGNDKWHGRFFGTWHGVKFSYDVDFEGPHDKLKGKARIDGAHYDWTGKFGGHSPKDIFDGDFTGTRYHGYFRLKEK